MDNGYKCYWRNSAQIVSPIDKEIQASIEKNLAPWPCKEEDVDKSPLIHDAGKLCWDAYTEKVASVLSKKVRFGTEIPQVPIVYTAMHGVGYSFVQASFAKFGLHPPVPTEEQVHPDPEFPTAAFPNPEEKGTLDLAMKKAEKEGIAVVCATDPDADRFCFAEFDKKEKKWRRFTGDEIGAILCWRQFEDWKESHPGGDPKTVAFVNSAVSSRFIDVVGKAEGFRTAQTLTGFKWIGNKMLDFEKEGVHALMGYEEAIGYALDSSIVVDKDGISAASVAGELVALLYHKGETIASYLASIQAKYGIAVSNNSYVLCYDPPTIPRIFDRLRALGKEKPENAAYGDTYIRKIVHPETKKEWLIEGIRDLHTGYDSSTPDKKATLPTSPDAEMLTFSFASGAVITLRTSGTEPKIKWYSELTGKDKAATEKELGELVTAVVEVCLQPKENNLKPPVVQ